METINNLASKAANVVAGKNNTTGTYENVTHSMPENDSVGGSSKPNYEGNYQVLPQFNIQHLTQHRNNRPPRPHQL
jgi:hypothetical protein